MADEISSTRHSSDPPASVLRHSSFHSSFVAARPAEVDTEEAKPEQSDASTVDSPPVVRAIKIDDETKAYVPKEFICPISGELLHDPVVLTASGLTYDRKHLCRALLKEPDRDPSTHIHYNEKLKYCDNVLVRKLLVRAYGKDAIQQYHDSVFLVEYEKAWKKRRSQPDRNPVQPGENFHLYRRIDASLFGMNRARIDKETAFTIASSVKNDAVAVAYTAWFLDPAAVGLAVDTCPKNGIMAAAMWKKAVNELGLVQLAKRGNAWAQCLEGRRQVLQMQNDERACFWLQKAADSGNAVAQWTLAGMYRTGKGVGKDMSVARELYLRAADSGHSCALSDLGVIYKKGLGVSAAGSVAAVFFRAAAEQGDCQAQFNLGCMYYQGCGVPQDKATAAFWCGLAAEQGHSDAQKCLDVTDRTRP